MFSTYLCVVFRNQIGNIDMKVSSGQVDVTKEKNLLIWALGTYRIHKH